MRRPARQPDDRNGSDKYQQIPGESPLMHDRHEPDAGQRTHRKATSPSSSRMIATYLTDIEQMLDEQRWDAALREASDLPRIAVALADPQLRSSGEEIRNWCQQWIQPPEMTERIVPTGAAEPVPTGALRRLQ